MNSVGPGPNVYFDGKETPTTGVFALSVHDSHPISLTAAEVRLLPAASRARAVSECAPLAVVVVFQAIEYGAGVSSPPTASHTSINYAPASPQYLEAEPLILLSPETFANRSGSLHTH